MRKEQPQTNQSIADGDNGQQHFPHHQVEYDAMMGGEERVEDTKAERDVEGVDGRLPPHSFPTASTSRGV